MEENYVKSQAADSIKKTPAFESFLIRFREELIKMDENSNILSFKLSYFKTPPKDSSSNDQEQEKESTCLLEELEVLLNRMEGINYKLHESVETLIDIVG